MWYVIQTLTGREEELMTMMRARLSGSLWKDCFLFQAEWRKRLGGQWLKQIKPLFPGYVFIDTELPEALFLELKKVPMLSRILGNGRFVFTAVEESERQFLEQLADICGTGVRLSVSSLVELDEKGMPVVKEGPLCHFQERIERINLHKRYAIVRIPFLHQEKTVLFGIRTREDDETAQ